MPSKYEAVKNALKKDILAGKFPIDAKLPTESNLMQQFEVSRHTVRRAVSDLENEHFVYKVQGGGMFVADWQKDWQAETKNKTIGVICTHIADYIFPKIISGIDKVLAQNDYTLLLANTHNNHQRERSSLINMLDMKVAGLIIEPTQSALPNPNLDLYQEIKKRQIPTIFLNATYPDLDFPALVVNDKQAEKQLIEHLFEQGHRNILGIFQVDDQQGVARMNGYLEAYQNNSKYALDSQIIMYHASDPLELLEKKVLNYLNSPTPPTALACYNDELAIRLMDLLKRHNYQIPNDISVVGFDNYEITKYLDPSLTTMNHAKEKMGACAGEMITQMILKKAKFETKVYEAEFIARASTAKK